MEHNGRTIFTALWDTGISENPYLSFKFKGAKVGGSIKPRWVDNKGESDAMVSEIAKAD